MNTYEFDKYVTDVEGLTEKLNTFGVAIIPNVLNKGECENGINGMWDYFEHISMTWEVPLHRNDSKTYRNYWKLYPMHSMLIQHWCVGHAQFVWDIRQNHKIANVFSDGIWKCKNEDLLVSFDGISMHLPPEYTNRGWYRGNKWYHTDQSYLRSGFECVQSFVTLNDVNRGDATLGFMEGSHRYHEEFRENFGVKDKKDWYKLNECQERFYLNRGCNFKRIMCPKGSLVLWDSRTIHCGVEPLRERENPNIRSIVYLCYMPRAECSDANLRKKQKAFKEMRMTSHWPCKPKLFGKNPRTYGNELPIIENISNPTVTEFGMRLAGF
jgi:hypothetical protein